MGEAGPQRERTFLGLVPLLGPVSPTTTDFLVAKSELTLGAVIRYKGGSISLFLEGVSYGPSCGM